MTVRSTGGRPVRSMDGRIVNGTDAEDDTYPFQVSLQYHGQHFCGGSIVNERWILTAAHCFDPNMVLPLVTVQAGTTDIGKGKNKTVKGVVKNVVGVAIHKEYMPFSGHYNDIALLLLKDPFEFNDHIKPVTLPRQLEETATYTPATVIGWGMNYTGGPIMTKLQTVEIEIVSDADCLEIYAGETHASNICAGVPEGGKGACIGDSGGPLIADGKQVGVVSWSVMPCASKGYPVVFTEVSFYIDWIKEVTEQPLVDDLEEDES
ncbi:trypsin-1 isoform X1 [Anabrus simplex]|uniref:trypsin-1 isoform X1 n=1 Tax=Anabrus simplex TaxID=316456 RepID=UPI0035A385BB